MNDIFNILQALQNRWKQERPSQLERGVWVALHEPISTDANNIDSSVSRAWFMNWHGIEERQPESFVIFVNNIRPPPGNREFEIGRASIAPYPTKGQFLVELYYAPLHASGNRVEFGEDGELKWIKVVWLS